MFRKPLSAIERCAGCKKGGIRFAIPPDALDYSPDPLAI